MLLCWLAVVVAAAAVVQGMPPASSPLSLSSIRSQLHQAIGVTHQHARRDASDDVHPCIQLIEEYEQTAGVVLDFNSPECVALDTLLEIDDATSCSSWEADFVDAMLANNTNRHAMCDNACFPHLLGVYQIIVQNQAVCQLEDLFGRECHASADCQGGAVCYGGVCRNTCEPGVEGGCTCDEVCSPALEGHLCFPDASCTHSAECNQGEVCLEGECTLPTEHHYRMSNVFHLKTLAFLCARPAPSEPYCFDNIPTLMPPSNTTKCDFYSSIPEGCCQATWEDYVVGCSHELDFDLVQTVENDLATCEVSTLAEPSCLAYPSSAVTLCHTQTVVSLYEVTLDFDSTLPTTDANPNSLRLLGAAALGVAPSSVESATAIEGASPAQLRVTLYSLEEDEVLEQSVFVGHQFQASADTMPAAHTWTMTDTSVKHIRSYAPKSFNPTRVPSFLQGLYTGSMHLFPTQGGTCCQNLSLGELTFQLGATTAIAVVAQPQDQATNCPFETRRLQFSNIQSVDTAFTFTANVTTDTFTATACFYFDSRRLAVQLNGGCPDAYQSPESCLGEAVTTGSTSVAVATVHCHSGLCECDQFDPCCFRAEPTSPQFQTAIVPVRYQMLERCLRSLTIPFAHAYQTLTAVDDGVTELYSFTDLASNARASEHSTIQTDCHYEVHEVESDLQSHVTNSIASVVQHASVTQANLTPEQVQLRLQELHNDFRGIFTLPMHDFHVALHRRFRALYDAHTAYTLPYPHLLAIFPVALGSRLDASGNQVIVVDDLLQPHMGSLYDLAFNASYSTLVTEQAVSKVITTINGVPALEWALHAANYVGSYKSQGVRLNAFLEQTHGEMSLTTTEPLGDAFTLQLEGGTTLALRFLYIALDSTARSGLTEMLALSNSNDFAGYVRHALVTLALNISDELDDIEGGDDRRRGSQGTPLTSRTKPTLANAQKKQDERLKLASFAEAMRNSSTSTNPCQEPTFNSASVSKRAFSFGSCIPELKATHNDQSDRQKRKHGGRVRRDALPTGNLTVINAWEPSPDTLSLLLHVSPEGERMVVYKLTTFADDDESFIQSCATFLFEALHYANIHNVDRLVFDVIGNGGGYVMLPNLLTSILAGPDHWSENTFAPYCQPYRMRMSPMLQVWNHVFGNSSEGFALHVPNTMTAADMDEFLTKLQFIQGLETAVQIHFPSINYTRFFETFEPLAQDASDVTDRQRADALRSYLQTMFDVDWSFITQYSEAGWFPLDVHLTEDGELFDPLMYPYLTPVERNWGGHTSLYTRPYSLECSPITHDMATDTLRALSRSAASLSIGLVTDGTCGSACSLFATVLQSYGIAVTFSYGGVHGDAMDGSSFAGGNVLGWDEFWPQMMVSQALGTLFAGDAHVPHTARLPTLFALPTPSTTRFNFNMNFVRAMGAHALPREFYNIPTHRQFAMWAPLQTDWVNGRLDRLAHLYTLVQREDWEDLKQNPQFFDPSCASFDSSPANPNNPNNPNNTGTHSHRGWIAGIIVVALVGGVGGAIVFIKMRNARRVQHYTQLKEYSVADGDGAEVVGDTRQLTTGYTEFDDI
eukprot:m.324625 g.324625  ORF g.324625 m.324625 type:complete len:1562 (+) comp16012_c0_seq1:1093-5778(+)